MKTTVKTTEFVTKEHEIEIPFYTKVFDKLYKICSDKEAIEVNPNNYGQPQISLSHPAAALGVFSAESSEHEFNEAYKKAHDLINSLAAA